jgi:hypothetical protein
MVWGPLECPLSIRLTELLKNNDVYGDIFWPPSSPDLSTCDFFLWGYSESRVFQTFGRLTQPQTENFWRKICHISCHVREMEIVMHPAHQCTRLDGRYLTGVVLNSNAVVTFLNNDKYSALNSHYFEYILINCVSLTIPKERCSTPHSSDDIFGTDTPSVFFGVSFMNSRNVLSLQMQETNYTTIWKTISQA